MQVENLNLSRDEKHKIDTVLLDFDGTLADTNQLVYASWQHTIKHFRGHEAGEADVWATFGEPLYDSMAKLLPEIPADDALDVYREYQRVRYLDEIKLYPGAIDTLEALIQNGFKAGLVTSRLKKSTLLAVEHFNLGKYFKTIITADDMTKHKPDPEPVYITLDAMGSVPERAMLVGDTKYDIGCAKNAGVIAVLMDYSIALASPEERALAAPDVVIEKLSDILTLVGIE